MIVLSSGARQALARLAETLDGITLEEDVADELEARGLVEPHGSGYVITATGSATNDVAREIH